MGIILEIYERDLRALEGLLFYGAVVGYCINNSIGSCIEKQEETCCFKVLSRVFLLPFTGIYISVRKSML